MFSRISHTFIAGLALLLLAPFFVRAQEPALQASEPAESQKDTIVINEAETVQSKAVLQFSVLDSIRVYFRQGKYQFQPDYQENGARIREVCSRIMNASKNGYIKLNNIHILAASSPEGAAALNERLSNNRGTSIRNFIVNNYAFDPSLITSDYLLMDWNVFHRLVNADTNVPQRQEILDIIAEKDWIRLKAIQTEQPKTWRYLLDNIFPSLRFTFAVFDYTITAEVELEYEFDDAITMSLSEDIPLDDDFFVDRLAGKAHAISAEEKKGELEGDKVPSLIARMERPATGETDEVQVLDRATGEVVTIQRPRKQIHVKLFNWEKFYTVSTHQYKEAYIKSNLATLPLLLPSLGYESVFAEHWSLGIMGYYSALDWFQPTVKFRILGAQPELRFWPTNKFFVGTHLNFGWYNVAWNKEYRYQDYKQGTPAYGIGVLTGLKVPLTSIPDTPWGIELTIGVGVMPLHYDIYYNVPNGRWAGEDSMTYWGIDQASVTITYRVGRKPLRWGQKVK